MSASESESSRISLRLSFLCCFLCLGGIAVACFILPRSVSAYLSVNQPVLMEHIAFIIVMLYAGLAVAAAVLVLLIFLLRLVQKGSIFTPVSGRLVFAVACLVILEGIVFALLGIVYLPAYAVTAVAVTMGLCFMVVSHVLRKAAAIKDENDGTI